VVGFVILDSLRRRHVAGLLVEQLHRQTSGLTLIEPPLLVLSVLAEGFSQQRVVVSVDLVVTVVDREQVIDAFVCCRLC
jgi:hypothetical protein